MPTITTFCLTLDLPPRMRKYVLPELLGKIGGRGEFLLRPWIYSSATEDETEREATLRGEGGEGKGPPTLTKKSRDFGIFLPNFTVSHCTYVKQVCLSFSTEERTRKIFRLSAHLLIKSFLLFFHSRKTLAAFPYSYAPPSPFFEAWLSPLPIRCPVSDATPDAVNERRWWCFFCSMVTLPHRTIEGGGTGGIPIIYLKTDPDYWWFFLGHAWVDAQMSITLGLRHACPILEWGDAQCWACLNEQRASTLDGMNKRKRRNSLSSLPPRATPPTGRRKVSSKRKSSIRHENAAHAAPPPCSTPSLLLRRRPSCLVRMSKTGH